MPSSFLSARFGKIPQKVTVGRMRGFRLTLRVMRYIIIWDLYNMSSVFA